MCGELQRPDSSRQRQYIKNVDLTYTASERKRARMIVSNPERILHLMNNRIRLEIYKKDPLFQIVSEHTNKQETIRMYNTLRRLQIDTIDKLRAASLQEICEDKDIVYKRLMVIMEIKEAIK